VAAASPEVGGGHRWPEGQPRRPPLLAGGGPATFPFFLFFFLLFFLLFKISLFIYFLINLYFLFRWTRVAILFV
jgi:hypothetical protein